MSSEEIPVDAVRERLKWWKRGSIVCALTEVFLGSVLGLLGQGRPDQGDRFVDSGSMFDEISAQIAALVPDGSWQGSAAQAYVAQNLAQSQRAKLTADLDRLTSGLVLSESYANLTAREKVIEMMAAVGVVGVACLTAEVMLEPDAAIAMFWVAVWFCTAMIGAAIYILIDLKNKEHANASNLQAVTRRLTDLVATLPTLSDAIPGLPDVPCPPAHFPPEFDAAGHSLALTLAGLPDDTSPPLPKTPDVSSALADLPGSPEFSTPALPSPGFPDFGAPDLPIPHVTGTPGLPDVFPGGLPTVSMANDFAVLRDFSGTPGGLPMMARLPAPLSQLSGLSQAASGLSQLTNVAGRHAQLISSLAQHGSQQQAPLADHVKEGDDNDGATRQRLHGGRGDNLSWPMRAGPIHVTLRNA
ncbi:EspA/EspE family type VII secretion system effector [Mycobacterium kansasii]|uniref:EspA/EspE family type VII secretion system effector n=1 Tax=Mycobacterium kansasii TaxID=1768 RepID=UPI00044C1539|nr:EspA/EspE family type VII secretion system effector [Mycobacterium kansasii]ARG57986.1 hypothetical protein B1T43_21510 [Mycobacterium kansasii]EUA01482.1 hypothetical protein I547_3651 [Mycobacterium kansasii 824]